MNTVLAALQPGCRPASWHRTEPFIPAAATIIILLTSFFRVSACRALAREAELKGLLSQLQKKVGQV